MGENERGSGQTKRGDRNLNKRPKIPHHHHHDDDDAKADLMMVDRCHTAADDSILRSSPSSPTSRDAPD